MATKLELTNRTTWDTRALRGLFLAVIRENSKDEGPIRTVRCDVVYSRAQGRVGGWAYLNGTQMRLMLPRPEHCPDRVLPVERVAFVIEHEVMHLRGYGHDRMGSLMRFRDASKGDRYAYARSRLVAEKAPSQPAPKPDVQVVRYMRALKREQEKERKIRRLQNGLKKDRRQIKYYERALAADGRLAAIKDADK